MEIRRATLTVRGSSSRTKPCLQRGRAKGMGGPSSHPVLPVADEPAGKPAIPGVGVGVGAEGKRGPGKKPPGLSRHSRHQRTVEAPREGGGVRVEKRGPRLPSSCLLPAFNRSMRQNRLKNSIAAHNAPRTFHIAGASRRTDLPTPSRPMSRATRTTRNFVAWDASCRADLSDDL